MKYEKIYDEFIDYDGGFIQRLRWDIPNRDIQIIACDKDYDHLLVKVNRFVDILHPIMVKTFIQEHINDVDNFM